MKMVLIFKVYFFNFHDFYLHDIKFVKSIKKIKFKSLKDGIYFEIFFTKLQYLKL